MDFGAELLSGDWRLPQSTPAFGAESFDACLTRDILNSLDCEALVRKPYTRDENGEASTPGDELHSVNREGNHSAHVEFTQINSCCEEVPRCAILQFKLCEISAQVRILVSDQGSCT